METHTFKALTYGGFFIAANKLISGIYTTNTPILYEENTTMDDLMGRARLALDMKLTIVSQDYLKNLKQCKLTDVTLTVNHD